MGRIYLLFIGIPLIELWLLVEIGQMLGGLVTIGLVILTGAVGVTLAKQQGLNTITQLRQDVGAGRFPANSLVDGLMILLTALVLITPGIVTDCVGFLFLIPRFRDLVKRLVKQDLEHVMRDPTSGVTVMVGKHSRATVDGERTGLFGGSCEGFGTEVSL